MWDEVDVDAIIARRPQVVLVDELAHSNVPGSRNEKRWQDIEELLAAGIEVISTVNIQHLESVNDVVNRITGVVQRETVPDAVVRRADQIELVDMSPEALQRRMAHGNIYAPEKVDAALGNYFRARQPRRVARARAAVGRRSGRGLAAGLHGAARHHELVGDARARARRGDRCAGRRRPHPPGGADGAPHEGRPHRSARRERRRAHSSEARVARRGTGGCSRSSAAAGTTSSGDDVPATLVAFATAQHATQIVLGTSRRSRWTELTQGSIINRVVREAKGIDVHVIATDDCARRRSRTGSSTPIASAYRRERLVSAFVVVRGRGRPAGRAGRAQLRAGSSSCRAR